MADEALESSDIKPTDIVFDCPHCGKSLAIDCRGAGLVIPCTDCGQDVVVPIPEGMDLADIDSTDEEREIRIMNLRRSLALAERRIIELENKLQAAASDKAAVEKFRVQDESRFKAIAEQVEPIQRALKEISQALAKILEIAHSAHVAK